MNKARFFISLVLAVAAVVIVLRYRVTQRLQSEQAQFQQQIDEAAELRATIAQMTTTPSASTNASLSAVEHLELLRLRNEIGQLRRDLGDESNRMPAQVGKTGAK